MAKQNIRVKPIELDWSGWVSWNDLLRDARSLPSIERPDSRSGVYEVRYANSNKRLTIGKASNLRMRIKQALVKGKVPHSAGDQIRRKERLSHLVVRWAVTDRPAAAEEDLHIKYRRKYGALPKYVQHT
jgi:hypothetical protein